MQIPAVHFGGVPVVVVAVAAAAAAGLADEPPPQSTQLVETEGPQTGCTHSELHNTLADNTQRGEGTGSLVDKRKAKVAQNEELLHTLGHPNRP